MPIAIPRFDAGDTVIVPDVRISDASALEIRSARVEDVHGMSALINQYASSNVMLARGPQYLYQHIQDYMVATAPASDDGRETVVACGSLHSGRIWRKSAPLPCIRPARTRAWAGGWWTRWWSAAAVWAFPGSLCSPWPNLSSAIAASRNFNGKACPLWSGWSAASARNFTDVTKSA